MKTFLFCLFAVLVLALVFRFGASAALLMLLAVGLFFPFQVLLLVGAIALFAFFNQL